MGKPIRTKLEAVFVFCDKKRQFTYNGFKTVFFDYPNTFWTYLNLLIHAGYVERYARGKYRVNIVPAREMTYSQLQREAHGPK